MDDYRRVLDFVREMLPFINNLVPKDKRSESINDDMRMSQLSEYLIDERDRFDEIQFVAGTIRQEEQDRLKRLVFRITRGKALTYFLDFSQHGAQKSVYIVVFQDVAGTGQKVEKVCDSFLGERF